MKKYLRDTLIILFLGISWIVLGFIVLMEVDDIDKKAKQIKKDIEAINQLRMEYESRNDRDAYEHHVTIVTGKQNNQGVP